VGWRHKWFNVSPGLGWKLITDNKSRKFWFYWDDEMIPALTIYRHGKRIASVNLLWEEEICELADIVIHNPKFRHCGLGKAIMQEVIQHVRNKSMTAIVGKIVSTHDGESFEYLQNWYRNQGFKVDVDQLFYNLRLSISTLPS
jgi:N-acetylglutamate synthase-like GNAT family acetyltransferase